MRILAALIVVLALATGANASRAKPVPKLVFPIVGSVTYTDDFGAPRAGGPHQGNDILADRKDLYAPMKIGPYLDFEFLGKCGGLEVQTDRRRKPVPTSTSAVHIFGVTLEKAPAELRLKQSEPGNIFHNDEKP